MRPIALLAAAALAACAPMQWVKPDAAPEQLARDQSECQQHAQLKASATAGLYRPADPYFVANPGGGAGVVWPSGATTDPYAHQMLEEYRLGQACMESRGYELVPAPKK